MKLFGVLLILGLYLLTAVMFLISWVDGSTRDMLFWGVLALMNQASLNNALRDD